MTVGGAVPVDSIAGRLHASAKLIRRKQNSLRMNLIVLYFNLEIELEMEFRLKLLLEMFLSLQRV